MPSQNRASDLAPGAMSVPGTHVMQLYESDAFLAESVGRTVQEGLEAGEVAIWIATHHHHRLVEAWVAQAGVDVPAARAAQRYVPLEVSETIASFMRDGALDTGRFATIAGPVLDGAAQRSRHGRFRVVGEGVAVLWAEGRRETAIALEALWREECVRRGNFSVMCPYPLSVFASHDDVALFEAMCERHTHVLPTETSEELDATDGRRRTIAAQQQQALVREGEARAGSVRFAFACKQCRKILLHAARIGTTEADRISAHLEVTHPGSLSKKPTSLGEILRQVVVVDS